MIIKDREGGITTYPTWAIIKPNRKYLESDSFYPPTHFLYIREYLE